MEVPKFKRIKLSKTTLLIAPIILFLGVKLGDRNYWIVSMILIILSIWQFFSLFEKRKPKTYRAA